MKIEDDGIHGETKQGVEEFMEYLVIEFRSCNGETGKPVTGNNLEP